MRLARFIAECGAASRRKAEELISEGRVTVNGQSVTTPAYTVDESNDSVTLNGQQLVLLQKRYFKFYKPCGFTCTKEDKFSKTIYDFLGNEYRDCNYVGRLDKESEGLLLLTNDGELLHALTHPSFEVPRTYIVTVSKPLQKADLDRMYKGIEDDGEVLRCDHVRIKTALLYEITLHTGRKREIRRMIKAVGKKVQRLMRINYAGIQLGNLHEGEIAPLTKQEITELKEIIQ